MMVAGDIKTEKGLGVKNAEVTLRSVQAGMEKQRLTDASGDFVFGDLPVMVDYHVKGKKRDDWMNGVSTLDLVMIQRHILGVAPFHNGYKMVAADVNNDTKVSASDMVVLRKLILGLITELPDNDSWRFLDGQTPIANPDNPWPLDEEIVIEGVDHDMMDQHLMGVKVGDVSQDASADGMVAETRTGKTLKLIMDEQYVNQAQLSYIDIKSSDIQEVNGMQFTLKTEGMELISIMPGKLNVDAHHYGQPADNIITFSWSSDMSQTIGKDEILFTLIVKPLTSGWLKDKLTLGSEVTHAEAYIGDNNEVAGISLRTTETNKTAAFTVEQNEPNPFKLHTRIGYNLPEQGEVTFTLTALDGKLISKKSWIAVKGANTIELNTADVSIPGVYYYSVSHKGETITKALVRVE